MISSLQADHLLLEPQEAALVAGFHQLVHERGGRGEAGGEAPLAGGQPEPQSDMGLAGAGRAQGNDVLAPLDPLAARPTPAPGALFSAGMALKSKLSRLLATGNFAALMRRSTMRRSRSISSQLHQPGQELHMIQALGRALAAPLSRIPAGRSAASGP